MNWRRAAEFTFFAGVLIAATCAALQVELELNKTRTWLHDSEVQVADNMRERDNAWKLYQADEEKLKSFQSECSNLDCKDMFSSEAAGVVSSTYWPMKMSTAALILFCHHSNLVNLGDNFPGARLSSFGQIEENRGVGPEFLITCDWIIPSSLWCQKDAMNP